MLLRSLLIATLPLVLAACAGTPAPGPDAASPPVLEALEHPLLVEVLLRVGPGDGVVPPMPDVDGGQHPRALENIIDEVDERSHGAVIAIEVNGAPASMFLDIMENLDFRAAKTINGLLGVAYRKKTGGAVRKD